MAAASVSEARRMRDVVIVTGASRGIGAATARLLGAQGADVVVNYREDREAAEAVVRDIEAAGGRGVPVAGDVGVEADILHLFAEAEKHFGTPTGLVNNAGIVGASKRRIEEMRFDQVLDVLRINVVGALIASREAVKRMSTRHGGRGGAIVNVSSIGALTGSPRAWIDYAASKGAVDTMTIGLAVEVAGCGIRVNGVRPGLIDTEIHARANMPDRAAKFGPSMPIGRAGSAREVAEAIVWLLSDKASYVTGAILDVAGGVR
jgi:NAD(P)-dependent dehydrogenase (short-subunit alcohol dehydrogenase family)